MPVYLDSKIRIDPLIEGVGLAGVLHRYPKRPQCLECKTAKPLGLNNPCPKCGVTKDEWIDDTSKPKRFEALFNNGLRFKLRYPDIYRTSGKIPHLSGAPNIQWAIELADPKETALIAEKTGTTDFRLSFRDNTRVTGDTRYLYNVMRREMDNLNIDTRNISDYVFTIRVTPNGKMKAWGFSVEKSLEPRPKAITLSANQQKLIADINDVAGGPTGEISKISLLNALTSGIGGVKFTPSDAEIVVNRPQDHGIVSKVV